MRRNRLPRISLRAPAIGDLTAKILAIGTAAAMLVGAVGCGAGAASDSPAPTSAQPINGTFAAPANRRTTEDRYLIIHADDAGLCHSVNRATIEALERGVVTSASMMVPAPAFEEFADYARQHPERDYGIHLTLNAEFKTYRWGPVMPASEVPGLIDPQGYLWQSEAQTAANARTDEVERELTAQIEKALMLGVPISHLDTHMGTCFLRADFLEVYVNLGIKYQLPVLIVRDGRALQIVSMPADVLRGMDDVVRKLDEQRLPVLDGLSMYYGGGAGRERWNHYFNVFRQLPAGVTELIVHCGYADGDLYAVTSSVSIREGDRRVMTDPATARELAKLKIKTINWKQFREMAGDKTPEKKHATPQ